jgi:hypothetical protein
MISQECRDAIKEASKLLEPFTNYKFIEKALTDMNSPIWREDRKIAYKAYEAKRLKAEEELLTALKEGKTLQYCYSRNRDKNPPIWDDLPKEKAYNFIEHGQWEYMRIKGDS